MGIGEGLLTGLLGGAVGGASEMLHRNHAMDKEDETARLETLRADIVLNRQKALEDYKVSKNEELAGKVTERAGMLASGRKITSPEVDAQAGAAMNAYNGALSRGEITEDDATKAAKAITEYSDANATQPSKPTIKDHMIASAQLGQSSWKDVAALEDKGAATETRMKIAEMQNALGLQKMDMQTQVALAKMDAAYSKIQNGSKDPADVQTMRFALDEINKTRAGEGKSQMSLEELLRSGLLGKSGDYETEMVKTNGTGEVLERTSTSRKKGTNDLTPSGLPTGAKAVGTSKGKTVYQLPDGSRIVEK